MLKKKKQLAAVNLDAWHEIPWVQKLKWDLGKKYERILLLFSFQMACLWTMVCFVILSKPKS